MQNGRHESLKHLIKDFLLIFREHILWVPDSSLVLSSNNERTVNKNVSKLRQNLAIVYALVFQVFLPLSIYYAVRYRTKIKFSLKF